MGLNSGYLLKSFPLYSGEIILIAWRCPNLQNLSGAKKNIYKNFQHSNDMIRTKEIFFSNSLFILQFISIFQVGKKRRKRSGEDVKLNEIDQARSLQYITKLVTSYIKQAKDKYWMNEASCTKTFHHWLIYLDLNLLPTIQSISL